MPIETRHWSIDSRFAPVTGGPIGDGGRLESILASRPAVQREVFLTLGKQPTTQFRSRAGTHAVDRDSALVALEVKRSESPRVVGAPALNLHSWCQRPGHDGVVEAFENRVSP
jgi:hypothetical protein